MAGSDKFLMYSFDGERRPVGLMHNLYNLEHLCRDAVDMGRTPVIPRPAFDRQHNLGRSVDTDWASYIDLAAIRVTDLKVDPKAEMRVHAVLETEWCRGNFTDEDFAMIGCRDDQGDPEVRVVVRVMPPSMDPWDGSDVRLRERYQVRLKYAEDIQGLIDSVVRNLGSYVAVHVRRGDRLALNRRIDSFTRAPSISRFLDGTFPAGTRVFLMSDERGEGFFDELRARHSVVTWRDLETVVEFMKVRNGDNYALFCIEKGIYYHATARVSSFIDGDSAEFSLSPYSMHDLYEPRWRKAKARLRSAVGKVVRKLRKLI